MDLVHLIELAIQGMTISLELFGALVIIYSGLLIFVRFFYLKFTQPSTDIRLRFARSIALSLEFFLAAEILRTVAIRRIEDLIIVGALVILRGMMTFLIHWEIDHDSRSLKKEQ